MDKIKVGFLGFGNVGTGAYKILQETGNEISHREGFEIEVKKILVRDTNKKRDVQADESLFTDNIQDIINDPEISIVAEFMGGIDPAKQYILSALENKKTVVTANKELMARHWPELEKAAQNNGAGLYYEASVAGGIPVIKVMSESLQANKVYEVMGIINGTTNYILTKMSEEGRDFHDVLAEAQRLGYAEPDPTADIEGFDAMYKLSILSSIAFHAKVPIDNIYREGITKITAEDIAYGKELGYAIRLLAIAKKNGTDIQARVHPTFIPVSHPLAAVRESYNAVFIKGDAVGNLMLYGRGAGDLPTGSAIVSDIITACHQENNHRYTTFYNENKASWQVRFEDDWETEFFIRLTVKDKPGVLAKIAGILGKHEVSIASVIQKDHNKDVVPLIFVSHHAKEQSIKKALDDIGKDEDVLQIENVIRVER
ncbi:homoserine dehydrogenase [Petroclostridium sp. X23]|uniref:homoserine dehydrogenase n=1 Tax=Petroclostridium sp. X23 TaxID=3045146 RepID=UPI0024ACDA01|nr:homoserine dehydrogenase [Petroclostridium sp. X23]WHH61212.1 homoserine dehydrogenase [Petroclostridium sp. X23]